MTLNAVIAFILRFSPNSTDFQADYITVVDIMSVKYCLSVPVFYFFSKTITHPAARSLCDSCVSCNHSVALIITFFTKCVLASVFSPLPFYTTGHIFNLKK